MRVAGLTTERIKIACKIKPDSDGSCPLNFHKGISAVQASLKCHSVQEIKTFNAKLHIEHYVRDSCNRWETKKGAYGFKFEVATVGIVRQRARPAFIIYTTSRVDAISSIESVTEGGSRDGMGTRMLYVYQMWGVLGHRIWFADRSRQSFKMYSNFVLHKRDSESKS